jgi:deoxycytidylate deaminase
MNPASEIAIRWLLEQQAAPEDFIDDLVQTLYEGCGKNEADSIEYRDRLLAAVRATEKEEPWGSIMELAIALHVEMEGVDKAIHNLGQLEKIAAAVESVPDNPLARRITSMKIKECIARLRA